MIGIILKDSIITATALFFMAAWVERPLPTGSVIVLVLMGLAFNVVQIGVVELFKFAFGRISWQIILIPFATAYLAYWVGRIGLLPNYNTLQFLGVFLIGLVIAVVLDLIQKYN